MITKSKCNKPNLLLIVNKRIDLLQKAGHIQCFFNLLNVQRFGDSWRLNQLVQLTQIRFDIHRYE